MKKIVSILTVLALVCLCAVPAFAVDTTAAVTVTTDKTTANPGDIITVTAALSENSQLATLTIELYYDTSAFEYVTNSAVKNEMSGLFTMAELNTNVAGRFRYVGITSSPATRGDTLFTVQLRVLVPDSTITASIEGATLNDDTDVASQVIANSALSATVACGHASTTTVPVTPAGCETAGTANIVCTVCDEVIGTQPIAATGHTPGEWVVATPATCENAGREVQNCTVCGAEVNSREIAALGHDVSEWTVTVEPTCTEAGSRTGTCARCGKTVPEEIPALGHDFGEWVVVKEATETEEGSRERVCSVCGEKETEVIPVLTTEAEEGTTSTANPEIPQTSGTVVGGITAAAMLAMAAGVAAVTLKKKREG